MLICVLFLSKDSNKHTHIRPFTPKQNSTYVKKNQKYTDIQDIPIKDSARKGKRGQVIICDYGYSEVSENSKGKVKRE